MHLSLVVKFKLPDPPSYKAPLEGFCSILHQSTLDLVEYESTIMLLPLSIATYTYLTFLMKHFLKFHMCVLYIIQTLES